MLRWLTREESSRSTRGRADKHSCLGVARTLLPTSLPMSPNMRRVHE